MMENRRTVCEPRFFAKPINRSIAGPIGHEVLIRTAAANVCHSDVHFKQGLYTCFMPAVLGHESAGIVEAVGSEVTYVKQGDHVIMCLSVFCDHCRYCTTGCPNLCEDRESTQSNSSSTNTRSEIREDVPLDKDALIGCGVTTGVGAALNTAKVTPGSTVAVFGCGGIGLSAI